jgi:hypothetical protein
MIRFSSFPLQIFHESPIAVTIAISITIFITISITITITITTIIQQLVTIIRLSRITHTMQ